MNLPCQEKNFLTGRKDERNNMFYNVLTVYGLNKGMSSPQHRPVVQKKCEGLFIRTSEKTPAVLGESDCMSCAAKNMSEKSKHGVDGMKLTNVS